jgi:hypothetical protein
MFPPVPKELFFAQWYKRYGKSTLVKCKGDGETATTTDEFASGLEKIGEDDRGFSIVKCLGSECIYQLGNNEFCKNKECQRMAALQVILPELKGMGIWQINTGSYNSIVNINSGIDWLQGLCGRYAMIPVTLMRVPTDVQYEGKKSKHYILQIDTKDVSIGDIQKFALDKKIEQALIPDPDETKDALFYDANSGRTALLAPAEEAPAEAAQGAPAQDQGNTKTDKEKPGQAAKKEQKGPLTQAFEKEQEGAKIRKAKKEEILAAIKGIKDADGVLEYCKVIKVDHTLDGLNDDDKDWLRSMVDDYIKELRAKESKKGTK